MRGGYDGATVNQRLINILHLRIPRATKMEGKEGLWVGGGGKMISKEEG